MEIYCDYHSKEASKQANARSVSSMPHTDRPRHTEANGGRLMQTLTDGKKQGRLERIETD